jgi:hypothetical protein
MAKVERNILIHASGDQIDVITRDGKRLAEWYAGVEKAEPDEVYPNPAGTLL